jgi:hypothetical protein
VSTPDQLRWLDGIVKAVIVLNLLDIVFTLYWVGEGWAEEANLLLQNMVSNQPVLFVLTKIALVSFGSFLLWKHRSHPFAVVGIFLIFLTYYFTLLHHLRFTSGFVRTIVGV